MTSSSIGLSMAGCELLKPNSGTRTLNSYLPPDKV
jgi:hypothetical protein